MTHESKPPVDFAYRIQTERCLLRCWSPTDAPLVRAAIDRSEDHLRPWIPFMSSEPRSLTQTARWLLGRRSWFDNGVHHCYGIFSSDEAELFGELTLMTSPFPREFELGYWIDVEHVGRGLATECTAAATRLLFEHLQAEVVEIKFAVPNRASRKIPEKLGYAHECTRAKRYVDCNGKRHDMEGYVLFAEDYPHSPAITFGYEPFTALGKPLSAPNQRTH